MCHQLIVINNLASYLCALLTPFIPTAYCTKDSFMVSYDVCSLFTNIPLSETIDIAVKLILENKTDLKLSKNELSCFVLQRHKHISILMEKSSIKLMEEQWTLP